ncbi:MAG: methionine gamma-lyase family protein [Bacilli bacterium]|nr:methionine gamma-lyase family protein [Bacilli bacterium]
MVDIMEINNLIIGSENKLKDIYKDIDDKSYQFSEKVLNAFHKYNISESCFNSTTGYGYGDLGREKIECVFADIFDAEKALVRNQFISGSHALNVCFFALLRPNDLLLSISGTPYDTLHEVIGIKDNPSSLKSFGIKYDEIDLVNDDFDYEKIKEYLSVNKVKVIEIQRSKGYSIRKSISIDKIEKVVKLIKEIDKDIIVMVDNCYCEFVEEKTPTGVGVDIMVGSLIKNPGGFIAPNGAYIVGKENLINLCGERLTLPGEGVEVGPTLGINKSILQGIYLAPSVVASSLKTAILTSKVLEELGFDVEPKYNDNRVDIVQTIIFKDKLKLIKYVQGIQMGSAVDSNALPEPSDMPGYDDKIIMASGSFTQGSSIEISCDGPLRDPYVAYQQGSVTYEYGKLALKRAIEYLIK